MTTNRIRLLCAFAALFPLSGGAGAQSLQPLGCLIEPHRVVTPRGLPAAAPVCCKARARLCCRTKMATSS